MTNPFYIALTLDQLNKMQSNYPPLPSQQQEEAIKQICGEVYQTHYHYRPFNVVLAVIVIVLGTVLIKRNSTAIARYIKNNSLKIILVITMAILALSVFVKDSKISKFEVDTVNKFFYTTSERIPESEFTKYEECRTKYLNSN